MTKTTIDVSLYSFKNKNLRQIVTAVLEGATVSDVNILLTDQNPTNREYWFKNIANVHYVHLPWDSFRSPAGHRRDDIRDSSSEYMLLMSDDTILNMGWDAELIESLKENCVISGQSMVKLFHKDYFFLGNEKTKTKQMELTQYVDRNLIFGKTEDFKKIEYPTMIKYYGEEEFVSLYLYMAGIDVYCMPSDFYKDANLRTLENSYTTISLEHGYNHFIELMQHPEIIRDHRIKRIKRPLFEFLEYHNIDTEKLNKLPYIRENVLYNVNNIKFLNKNSSKFVDMPNSIE